MCSICSEFYGWGEMPITRKAIKRHVESSHHQDALSAFNQPRPPSPIAIDTGNTFTATSIPLQQANIYTNSNKTVHAHHTVSELIEDIVFAEDTHDLDDFGAFPFAGADADDTLDIDDSPIYWSDARFLKELGFSGAFREEWGEDMTLTNVMQHLGAFSLFLIRFCLPSLAHNF